MGWKYEVLAWLPLEDEGYTDVAVYYGNSLIKSIIAMRRAKKASGCVTLKWR